MKNSDLVSKKFGVKWRDILVHYTSLIMPHTACPHCAVKVRAKKDFRVFSGSWYGCRACFDKKDISSTDIARFRLETYALLQPGSEWMLPPKESICPVCDEYIANGVGSAPWAILKPRASPEGMDQTQCFGCCYRSASSRLGTNKGLRDSMKEATELYLSSLLKKDPMASYATQEQRQSQADAQRLCDMQDRLERVEDMLKDVLKLLRAGAIAQPSKAEVPERLIFESDADIKRLLPHPAFASVAEPPTTAGLLMDVVGYDPTRAPLLGQVEDWPSGLMTEAERLVNRYKDSQTVQLVVDMFGGWPEDEMRIHLIAEAIKRLCPQLVIDTLHGADSNV